MSLQIEIMVSDAATPFLNKLRSGLTDRNDLHAYMAPQLESLTRNYIRSEAPKRHKTARRLQASPTNHLLKAAEAIESSHSSSTVVVSIPRSSGLSRALRAFDLTPKNGSKWLTLPVHARSYGRRAREFQDLEFIPLGKDKAGLDQAGLFLRGKSDGVMLMLYLLKKKVHIAQDRTLLPSDKQYGTAAEIGARNYIKDLKEDRV